MKFVKKFTRNHASIGNYTIAYDRMEKYHKVRRDRRFVEDLVKNRVSKHLFRMGDTMLNRNHQQ